MVTTPSLRDVGRSMCRNELEPKHMRIKATQGVHELSYV